MGKKRLGLSLEKDAGYSKVIVLCSAILSGFTFGLPAFLGVLTAQWKAEYGFDQGRAALHQRFQQGFLYFGSTVVSLFYKQLTPRKWLCFSSGLGLLGYCIIYLAYYVPIDSFIYCQIGGGILAGLGAGFSFGIICITPQHWLDKTRDRMNPYLFIGAPLFVTVSIPAGIILIGIYGWSGALLLMIGFFIQQFIVTVLFMAHESDTNSKEPQQNSISNRVKAIKNECLSVPGVGAMLFNCAVCSGFIMSAVFTEVNNVAMEEGLEVKQAQSLILFSSIPEFLLFRPLWGFVTKYSDAATLQILWCFIFMISQAILSVASGFYAFIAGMVAFSLGLAGYSGLKFVIFIDLVGMANLPNVLIFDTLLDATMTIVVPYICNWLNSLYESKKILFYVNCGAAFICIFTSIYIRSCLRKKKENEDRKISEELVKNCKGPETVTETVKAD